MNFQGMNLFDTKNSHLRLFVFYLDRSTYILLISSNIYFSSTRVKNWIHNQNNLLNITTSSAFDEKFSIYTSRGKWFKNRLSDTYINPHQWPNNKKRLWTIFSYHRSEAPIVHVHYLSTVFVKCSGRPKEKRENFRVTGSDDFLLQLRLCFCNSPLEPGGGRFPFRRVFPHHAVGCAGRGLRQARPRPLMHYYSEPLVSLWFYMPREYSTASPPRVPIVFSSRWRGFYSNAGETLRACRRSKRRRPFRDPLSFGIIGRGRKYWCFAYVSPVASRYLSAPGNPNLGNWPITYATTFMFILWTLVMDVFFFINVLSKIISLS